MIAEQELIWRVPNRLDGFEWLWDNYGRPNENFGIDRQGWTAVAGYIWMTEPIYLFYTLKFDDIWD